MGFLEKIAEKLINQYGNQLHHLVMVFPTRRARLYFYRYLQAQKPPGANIWAPDIFSINDFMAQLSKLHIIDSLELIFQLYILYQQHVKDYPKNFEEFFPWGEMLIADFDEIDKYLIDARQLFNNLKNLKDIEDITKEEQSPIYNRYTSFWQDLEGVYKKFKHQLHSNNQAYEGMVYREVAEKIEDSDLLDTQPWEKVIFCGFNALTRSEEMIISNMVNSGKAEIYWDMDRYFVEDINQEAGHFFRENKKNLGLNNPLWIEDQLSEPKNINIIEVQSKISQAKALGIKLADLTDLPTDTQNTAVVLPDETLLFPVLNSLPETIRELNVTIGYPLRQTPVFRLLDSIMEMHQRAIEGKLKIKHTNPHSHWEFYYKDLHTLLNHPYIKPLAPTEINNLLSTIKKENLIYLKADDITFASIILKNLFIIRHDSKDLLDYFLQLLDSIRRSYENRESDILSLDFEYIYHFYTMITRLKDSMSRNHLLLDLRSFRKLFNEVLQGTRIPFTGEPLRGLQIMGVLETQTLDFNHLFILSVNEGYLPQGKSQQSFIPYDVRKIFKLPTYQEKDAIAAYHFYRLLKNSKNITLFYTSEAKGMGKSEKSRFIDQILIEYAEKNKQANINQHIIDFSIESQTDKEITIPKSLQTLERLAKFKYSPSSLLTYLTCSLQFYFTYILNLKEEEEVLDSPDSRLLGDIIHLALQKLYQPYYQMGKEVMKEDIENIQNNSESILMEVFLKKSRDQNLFVGRNRISLEIMKKLLNTFFEKEKQNSNFKILMLEKKITGAQFTVPLKGQYQKIQLQGTIDRMDCKKNTYRIIDYKTGNTHSLKLKSLEEFNHLFSNQEISKRRELFQLLFYRLLIKQMGYDHGIFKLAIYPFKNLKEGLKFITIGKTDTIDSQILESFKNQLELIFQDLFNKGKPFMQTKDKKNCQHCPFKRICNRYHTI